MNKKAYISYSIEDKDLFILSSLSQILRNYGYSVNTGYSLGVGQNINDSIRFSISNCSLFIGLVTNNGLNSKWAIKEWERAIQMNKTSIFLVEENANINHLFFNKSSLIYFNRQSPNSAILTTEEIIRKAKRSNETGNLVIGGLIALAAIKLLSND